MTRHILPIILVLGCSTEGTIEDPEPVEDPACAGETPSARVVDGELPWDLDRDLDSDRPVCPDDEPDCDRIDASDVPEDEEAGFMEALADPVTSTGKYRIWPNGRIPYKFARDSAGNILVNSTTRTRLSQAMTNWETLTEGRIKFRPKQASDIAYVMVRQGSPRVSPFVGYRKDQVSQLYLRDSEYLTVIKHELGHVVGLHHEQRRSDRLNYIQVRTANIVDSDLCRYQFSVCTACKKVGTYDRLSVMHYRTTDLANCRTGPVLLKLDGSAISHYWQLSTRDLNAVATMYDSGSTPPPTTDTLPPSGSLVTGALCASVTESNAMQSAKCDGMGNQDWRITAAGQLRVQSSMQCAAIVGCSTAGALVEQAGCADDALDQKWTFEELEIINGMTQKCLDVPGGYTGGQVVAFKACSGADTQLFRYRPELESIEAGGLCVTASDRAAAGDDIVMQPCDGRDTQRWIQARGSFVTKANTARCMRVEAGPTTGTKLELADCNDSIDQRWALRGTIRDARSQLCLQGSTAAATQLALTPCDGTPEQTWTFWSR